MRAEIKLEGVVDKYSLGDLPASKLFRVRRVTAKQSYAPDYIDNAIALGVIRGNGYDLVILLSNTGDEVFAVPSRILAKSFEAHSLASGSEVKIIQTTE